MVVITIYAKFNDPTVNSMIFEIYGVVLDKSTVVLLRLHRKRQTG